MENVRGFTTKLQLFITAGANCTFTSFPYLPLPLLQKFGVNQASHKTQKHCGSEIKMIFLYFMHPFQRNFQSSVVIWILHTGIDNHDRNKSKANSFVKNSNGRLNIFLILQIKVQTSLKSRKMIRYCSNNTAYRQSNGGKCQNL